MSEETKLELVEECRLIFGEEAAAQMRVKIGLPPVSAPDKAA